jgi:hypothetical protein
MFLRLRRRRAPDAATDVGQDVRELDLGLGSRPCLGCDVVALTVGAEAQAERAAALALAFDDLAGWGSGHHFSFRRCFQSS